MDIKDTQIEKKETKLFLCTNAMIVYIENLKISNKKYLLELINNNRKVAGYSVLIQKSFTFLYKVLAINKWNLKLKTQYHLY